MGNVLLRKAAHQRSAATRRGALERLFTLLFDGLVYNQIWEDPAVDLEALQLKPHHRLMTIASGGCNVLNYLTGAPERIIAVDLNPHHVALTRLKTAALEFLPDYESFFRFFGQAADARNVAAFDRLIAGNLDVTTRHYWERRILLRGRRINMFAHNLYRYGLLGRFIAFLHLVARLNGERLENILNACDLAEQRQDFERHIAPLFETKLVRLLARLPVTFYGLGIPPAQYDELVASGGGDVVATLRERVQRLACNFPVTDNYFAWQAFGRKYDSGRRIAVPPYLRAENYEAVKPRVNRIEIHHASMTEFLAAQPARSIHRFVLLDAQDWMSAQQTANLWTEIDRTAAGSDARVIFRTAGPDSPLPRKLPSSLQSGWRYLTEYSRELFARDRSSIYGGFHLYARADA
jgi:S-adenosylmethionine-diacylglycerol 3-amino-3-carboxypropyl transferase